MIDVAPPPPSYAVPYRGPLLEVVRPLTHVSLLCRLLGLDVGNHDVYGCALVNVMACMIVIPKVERQVTQEVQDRIRAHELAHCNGWRHE